MFDDDLRPFFEVTAVMYQYVHAPGFILKQ
jgi:hypothetical protein